MSEDELEAARRGQAELVRTSLYSTHICQKYYGCFLSDVTFSRPFSMLKILLFSRLNDWARRLEADLQVQLVSVV